MERRICVFAGSGLGTRSAYAEAARQLGASLAAHGLGLVYGGGSVGLMGALAEGALAGGGEVIGVIPRALAAREIALGRLGDNLRVVGSMHERKAQMAALSDAFIALPGGLGTYEELFEMLTWAQLGLHPKPIGVLNVADYYAPLLALIQHAAAEGFIPPWDRDLLLVDDGPAALLDRVLAYQPVARPGKLSWITREET
jgi:uncharacterized protein (TIGR00730 family)